MELFDFEIMYSGIASTPTVPDVKIGFTVYCKFVDLYNDEQQSYLYLNRNILSSGFNTIQVGGTALGGALEQYIGTVVAKQGHRTVIVVANDIEYTCHTELGEEFEINDIVLVYEHISHKPGRFGNQIWNATQKMLTQPGILSITLDLKGNDGSGIGRVNLDPYTGEVHYGSGLES